MRRWLVFDWRSRLVLRMYRRARRCQPSLGYEPYDVRLCRPASSLLANLTSADVRCEVVSGLGRLPRLTLFRRVRFTDPFTEQPVRDRASPTSGSGIHTVDVLFVYGEH